MNCHTLKDAGATGHRRPEPRPGEAVEETWSSTASRTARTSCPRSRASSRRADPGRRRLRLLGRRQVAPRGRGQRAAASASRSTTTCVIGTVKRFLAPETTPFSSQFERPSGCVEMMISSAPKVRSASSIACSGSASPTWPLASMPSSPSACRLRSSRSCAALRRAVLVRDEVPERRVQRRRDDEHPRGPALGRSPDRLVQPAPGNRLVRDHEHPVLVGGRRPRAHRLRDRRRVPVAVQEPGDRGGGQHERTPPRRPRRLRAPRRRRSRRSTRSRRSGTGTPRARS